MKVFSTSGFVYTILSGVIFVLVMTIVYHAKEDRAEKTRSLDAQEDTVVVVEDSDRIEILDRETYSHGTIYIIEVDGTEFVMNSRGGIVLLKPLPECWERSTKWFVTPRGVHE